MTLIPPLRTAGGVGGLGPFSYTPLGSQNLPDSSVGAASTFAAVTLGTADPNRYIVVCAAQAREDTTADVSTCEVAGVSATKIGHVHSTAGLEVSAYMWIAKVPTGATGDIVIDTGANGRDTRGVSWYALYNLVNGGAATDVQTRSSVGSLSVSTDADGVAIAIASAINGSTIERRAASGSAATTGASQGAAVEETTTVLTGISQDYLSGEISTTSQNDNELLILASFS